MTSSDVGVADDPDYGGDIRHMWETVLRTKFNNKRQFAQVVKYLGLIIAVYKDRIVITVSV